MRLAAAAAAAVGAWCAAATVHAVPQVAEEPQSAAAAQCPKCPVKQHEVGRRPVYPPTARHRSPHSPRYTPLYTQAHHPPIGHDDIHGLLGAGPPPIMPCESHFRPLSVPACTGCLSRAYDACLCTCRDSAAGCAPRWG
jgi:hypothetical protein